MFCVLCPGICFRFLYSRPLKVTLCFHPEWTTGDVEQCLKTQTGLAGRTGRTGDQMTLQTQTMLKIGLEFENRNNRRNIEPLVELKNGETYNGHLVNCDTWMNIHLREVICTSKDGDRFWRMPECYIRGNTIKYLRVPDEVEQVIDKVQEETKSRADRKPPGVGRGRGRGREDSTSGGRPAKGMGGRGLDDGGAKGMGGGRGRGGAGGRTGGSRVYWARQVIKAEVLNSRRFANFKGHFTPPVCKKSDIMKKRNFLFWMFVLCSELYPRQWH
ncbi:unnamed protein product [Camellia sinensis]